MQEAALTESHRQFLEKNIGSIDSIEMLAGYASTREYFRVRDANQAYVFCIDSSFRGVSAYKYPFFIVADLFREKGITVPEIYAYDEEEGLLLLQDGGDHHVQHVYPDLSPEQGRTLYRELVGIVADIQHIEGEKSQIPFSLCFDPEKLMFEFDFFIEHTLLNYYHAVISDDELSVLREEFSRICDILYRPEYFVLNHRDYHSRNILMHESEPFVLDFQDARMGLPQYDAVSLLRDAYTPLDDELVDAMKRIHFDALRERGYEKMNWEEYQHYFDVMAFQRNVKAMGSFGYQITARQNAIYERFITSPLKYLLDYMDRRTELRKAGKILLNYMGSHG